MSKKKLPNKGTAEWHKMKLTELGVEFDKNLKADELKKLYQENVKQEEVISTEIVMKANGRVYLREQATTESDYIKVIERDEEVFVIEEVDGWAKTAEGFVMASFLDLVE